MGSESCRHKVRVGFGLTTGFASRYPHNCLPVPAFPVPPRSAVMAVRQILSALGLFVICSPLDAAPPDPTRTAIAIDAALARTAAAPVTDDATFRRRVTLV